MGRFADLIARKIRERAELEARLTPEQLAAHDAERKRQFDIEMWGEPALVDPDRVWAREEIHWLTDEDLAWIDTLTPEDFTPFDMSWLGPTQGGPRYPDN